MRVVRLTVLLVFSVLVSYGAIAQEQPVDDLARDLSQLSVAIADGDQQRASELATALASVDFADAGFTRGEATSIQLDLVDVLEQAGQVDAAIEVLNSALETNLGAISVAADAPAIQSDLRNEHISMLRRLSQLQLEAGRPAEAADTLDQALNLAETLFGPDAAELRYILEEKVNADTLARRPTALTINRIDAIDTAESAVPLASLGTAAGAGSTSTASPGTLPFERIRVFFASSRNATDRREPKKAFGSRRGDDTVYGSALVSVPKNRLPGALPRPGWGDVFGANENRHIVLKRIEPTPRTSDFVERLSRSIESQPVGSQEAFVYVHGFNTDFESAALRTAQLAVDLDMRGGGIFYAWPSGKGMLGYQEGQNNSSWAVDGLVDLLETVTPEADRIHLIAHSMGNRVLLGALDELADRGFEIDTREGPVFDQIVWASPDEDAEVFADKAVDIKALAAGMTVYASRFDRALSLSSMLGGDYPRAGQAPPLEQIAELVTFVDTSNIDRGRADVIAHSDYAGSAIEDLRAVLWLSLAPPSRCTLVRETLEDGTEYWASSRDEGCGETEFRRAISALRLYGEAAVERIDELIAALRDEGQFDQVRSWSEAKSILSAIK